MAGQNDRGAFLLGVEDDARNVTPEYLSGALFRAISLLELAAMEHVGYSQHWLRVDAACLRIVREHLDTRH